MIKSDFFLQNVLKKFRFFSAKFVKKNQNNTKSSGTRKRLKISDAKFLPVTRNSDLITNINKKGDITKVSGIQTFTSQHFVRK